MDVPENMRPRPDSSQDVLKRFIDRAYNERAWEAAPKKNEELCRPSRSQPGGGAARANDSPRKQVAAEPKAPAAPVANLLDFDAPLPRAPQDPVAACGPSGLLDGDLLGVATQAAPTPAGGLFTGFAQAPAAPLAAPAAGPALFD